MIEQLASAIDHSTGMSPSFSLLTGKGYSAYELGTKRHFRSRLLHHLGRVFTGRIIYELKPLIKMNKRDYPAILFVAR